MIAHYMICLISLEFKDCMAIAAVAISLISLAIVLRNAKMNVRLSIQQTLFKTVIEKAKDCNEIWKDVPQHEYKKIEYPQVATVKGLIITLEIIDTAIELFSKNYQRISSEKKLYYRLLYNQLDTNIRDLIKLSPKMEKYKENEYYKDYVDTLQKAFWVYFEKVK